MSNSNPTEAPRHNPHLNLIQSLRGIAALLIALFHVNFMSIRIFKEPFFFNIFRFAWLTIIFFFVLSGFIMFYAHRKEMWVQSFARFKTFWLKRFIRIYPIYWLVSGIILIALIFIPAFAEARGDLEPGWIIKSFLLYPDHKFPILDVGWTLRFEIFFYFVFSLTIILKRQIYLPIMAFWVILTMAQSVRIFHFDNTTPWPLLIFHGFNIEFLMGFLAGYIVLNYNIPDRKEIFGIGVSLFFLFGLMSNYYRELNIGRDIIHIFLIGIPCMLMIIGAASWDLNEPPKIHPLLLYLGNASYSVFLVHGPVVSALIRMASKLQLTIFGNHQLINLIVWFLSVVAGCVFYSFIEKPLVEWVRQKLFPKKVVA